MKLFKKKEKDIFAEELVQSPGKTAMKNFFRRKLSLVGVGIFSFVVLFVIIGSILTPINFRHFDSTQINVRPGFQQLNVPAALMSNARDIDFGSRFGVGVDNEGRLYMWGHLDDALQYGFGWRRSHTLPRDTNIVFFDIEGPLRMVAAGLDHIVAIEESGRIHAWGTGTHLATLDVPSHLHDRNIIDLRAGSWVTIALDDQGNLTLWGNDTNFWSPHRYIGRSFAGEVKGFDMGTFSTIVLTFDGRVYTPMRGAGQVIGVAAENDDEEKETDLPGDVPMQVQGRAVDVAMTDTVFAALLDDGTVVTWTNAPNPIRRDAVALIAPDHPIQGRVTQIEAGRWHFSALLDDGSVYSWGYNHLRQTNAPSSASGNASLHVGYFQNAAIDANGNVTTWGHRGYLFGSDGVGRDLFGRVVHGGLITFSIGFIAVILASIIGIILGGIAGYFGKWPDLIIMRIAEVMESLPFIPLVMILFSIIQVNFPFMTEMQRVMLIMVVLGLITWPGFCRQTRAQILYMREQEFVISAQAMGVRSSGIIFRHIMPNALSVVMVSITLSLATALLIEATLSFLGFGVVEPTPTWGNMLDAARDAITMVNHWWRWFFPALFLGLSTTSISIMGDGLRDALDPRVSGGR